MDANPERPEMSQKITQEIKLEYANSTLIIDQQLNPKTIRDALKKLEQTASEHGQAIGIAAASPLIMKLISDWAETLKEKGITLVPLSANLPEKLS